MLMTVLIALSLYLAACYAYGIYLLVRRGRRPDPMRESSDPASIVVHKYPEPSRLSGKAA